MKAKETKQAEAIERQAKYDALSLTDRITRARERRGNSKREIARLLKKEGFVKGGA